MSNQTLRDEIGNMNIFQRLVTIIVLVVIGLRIWAQPANELLFAQETPDFATFAPDAYLGAESCLDCHEAPTTRRKERGVTNFVHLTESAVWDKEDKHSLAYKKSTPNPTL